MITVLESSYDAMIDITGTGSTFWPKPFTWYEARGLLQTIIGFFVIHIFYRLACFVVFSHPVR